MSAEDEQEGFGFLGEEQDGKQNDQEDLDLDPDVSDPETEVNLEDGTVSETKIVPTWRKYREFNQLQKAAFKSSRYLPRDKFEEMLRVEQSLDSKVEEHIARALEAPLGSSGPLLLEALWLIHRLSQGVLLTLVRRSVGELVVKCLQYLYHVGLTKDVAADKIRYWLSKLGHQKLDLEPIDSYFADVEVLKNHLTKYFERYHSTEELNVAADSGFSTIKSILYIVKRFKNSFIVHEDFLINYMFAKKYDFAHPEFQDFMSLILPVAKLSSKRLDALCNMQIVARKLDTKNSSISLKFLRNAAKNPHFRASEALLGLLWKDTQYFRQAMNDMRTLSKNSANISKMGQMWTNLLLPKAGAVSTEIQHSVDRSLHTLRGLLECWTSEFHPKTLPTASREFLFMVLGSFASAFSRQLLVHRKKHPELAQKVFDFLKEPLRKCLNFAIFSKFNATFHIRLVRLAYLDVEYFAEFFLKKIKYAFEFPGFIKTNVIKVIEGLTTLICKQEKLSENLYWIVPRLLDELENSAESQNAIFIGSCLCSILEHFINVDRTGKGPAHLRPLKDDMDQAALKLFEFYQRKSGDFTMPNQLVTVLVGLGPYVTKKLTPLLVDLLKQGFEKSNLANSSEYFYQLYLASPEQAETEAKKYLLKRLLVAQDPKDPSAFLLGWTLHKLGVTSVSYALASDNETTLKKHIQFVQALGTRSLRLTSELLQLSVTFLALALESKHDSVVQLAAAALSGLLNGFNIEFVGLIPIWEYEEKLHEKKHQETKEKFWLDDLKANQARAALIFESIYFGALVAIENLIAGATGSPKTKLILPEVFPSDEFYKATLTESAQHAVQDSATESKLAGLLNLILYLSQTEFIANLRLYSPTHKSLLESAFVRVSSYQLETGTYRVPKLRDPLLRLYLEIMNDCRRLVLQFSNAAQNLSMLAQSLHLYEDIDMFAKLSTSKAINAQYRGLALTLLEDKSLEPFVALHPPAELALYLVDPAVPKCSSAHWLFDAGVSQGTLVKYFRTFFQISGLLYASFDASGISSFVSIVQRSWFIPDDQFVIDNCLTPWSKIAAIEQNQEIKYTTTYKILGIAMSRCMPAHTLQSDGLIIAFLDLASQLIKKANFSKILPVFMMTIEYIIRGARITAESSLVANIETNIQTLNNLEESQTTLVELLSAITKSLVAFRFWSTAQRARFLLISMKGLASKDINKRIVWMSILLFANRLLKKTDIKETKIRVEPGPFLDSNGTASKEHVFQAVQEIRKRLGLTNSGSTIAITDSQEQQFGRVHGGLFPTKSTHSFSLPWEFAAFEYVDNTPAAAASILEDLDQRRQIEGALIEFLRLAIMEYSETINESNLSIKYNFVRILVETSTTAGNFGKESQMFAALKTASTLLGCHSILHVFEAIKKEFFESDQSADAKKVLMILLAAGLSASGRYTQSEFETYTSFFINTLKPMMNKTGFKSVETIITYLGLALKQTLPYSRLNYFFELLYRTMKDEQVENQPYYLRLLSFQYSVSQILVHDYWQDVVSNTLPKLSFEEMASLSNMSLIFMTVGFNRISVAYSAEFAASGLASLPTEHLSGRLMGKEAHQHFQELLETAVTKVKQQKLLGKIEFLKTAVSILYAKRLDTQNFPEVTSILSLAFSIDSQEDLGMQQIVSVFQKTLLRLPMVLTVVEEARDQFAEFLSQQFDAITSIDSLKVVVALAGLTVDRTITPAAASLIEKIARDQRVPLREAIEVVFRHQVFSDLANTELYSYARQIYQKITAAAQEK